MTSNHLPSPARRVRVRRNPHRASYDTPAVYAVLDAALYSHVATVRDGRPIVLPMAHARVDDKLVLHGSPAAGLFRDARRRSSVCVTATLFDGLVLGRSARSHSMNYRSVTVHGEASPITEPDALTAALRALVEHLTPGRWEEVRRPTVSEMRETAVWQVPIRDASVKTRSGSISDPTSDRALPVWAGHVPARLVYDRPVPADGLPHDIELPCYIEALLSERSHAGEKVGEDGVGVHG